jgi:hypothetical protein
MTSSNGGYDPELLTIKAESLIKNAGFVRDILTMKTMINKKSYHAIIISATYYIYINIILVLSTF